MHAIGVRIVLDDFGTGFSSLSYLRSFPFDRIKIDRSFVKDVGLRNDADAIIRAIVGLGKSLRIPVTAEGVETLEQLELVRVEGCDEAQGYLISKPIPAGNVALLLSSRTMTIAPSSGYHAPEGNSNAWLA
jgi:EAL domain-containing protein (putative c-di-GMP-specific phosphodiesterase class I)